MVATLVDWNLDEICSDATSSNTGRKNRVCLIIEQMLGRDLLYLACHYHVELLTGAAHHQAVGISSGPAIAFIKQFEKQWKCFDRSKCDNASTDGEPHKRFTMLKEI